MRGLGRFHLARTVIIEDVLEVRSWEGCKKLCVGKRKGGVISDVGL